MLAHNDFDDFDKNIVATLKLLVHKKFRNKDLENSFKLYMRIKKYKRKWMKLMHAFLLNKNKKN